MARVLLIGGAGAVGRSAVDDLLTHTDHDLAILDPARDQAEAVRATAPDRITLAEVTGDELEDSIRAAMGTTDVAINTTPMRYAVGIARIAIETGTDLVDLGIWSDDTERELELHDDAVRAGTCIVGGCGVAPGLTNLLAREGARRLDAVERITIWSFIAGDLYSLPSHYGDRVNSTKAGAVVFENGRMRHLDAAAVDAAEAEVEFPAPFGLQRVRPMPHPEVVTIPRNVAVENVSYSTGYPREETAHLKMLLELGFGDGEPLEVDGAVVAPARVASAVLLRNEVETANVKRLTLTGSTDGKPATFRYDVVATSSTGSATAEASGFVAAIICDLVATGTREPGVHPPEELLDGEDVIARVRERGVTVTVR